MVTPRQVGGHVGVLGVPVSGGVNDISIRDGEVVEHGDDGVRAGLGTSTANTRDVPRFGALLWSLHPYVLLCSSLLLDHKDSGYKVAPGAVFGRRPAALVSRLEEEEGEGGDERSLHLPKYLSRVSSPKVAKTPRNDQIDEF